jgi:hypothetical protein
MKNYLINEKQLKRILEQVEDEENKSEDDQTNDETVSSGFFDDIVKKPLDSNDPLKMFFDSLN